MMSQSYAHTGLLADGLPFVVVCLLSVLVHSHLLFTACSLAWNSNESSLSSASVVLAEGLRERLTVGLPPRY